mgnify:CR=1 FL=1
MPIDFSPDVVLIVLICSAAIVGGGVIKGTLGVGLPLFAVPVMSLFISSTQAIALVSVPVLVSNIWQVWQEGSLKTSLKRFWPLMLTQAIVTVFSVYWTLSFSVRELNMVLAFALIGPWCLWPSSQASISHQKKNLRPVPSWGLPPGCWVAHLH